MLLRRPPSALIALHLLPAPAPPQTEKGALEKELVAAQERLAATEAASADAAHLSEQQQAMLQEELEQARLAVAAAQAAADAATQQEELAGVQQQLLEAAAGGTPAAKLQGQLQLAHSALAQAHARQCAAGLATRSPEVGRVSSAISRTAACSASAQGACAAAPVRAANLCTCAPRLQIMSASRVQLERVQQLLEAPSPLRAENSALRQQVARARTLVAAHSPAAGQQQPQRSSGAPQGSPMPLALFGRPPSASDAAGSPASDVFSSPLPSQTTLTVDYRSLHPSMVSRR